MDAGRILQMVTERQHDTDAEELRRDVLKRALQYVEYRFHWELYSNDEKAENDRYRTSAHNAFMDAVNIYMRYLDQRNGTQTGGLGPDRKENGDLACRIVCEVALGNR